MSRITFQIIVIVCLFLGGCAPPASGGNPRPVNLQATIQNKGSDTMVNLALAWAEAYQIENPEIQVSVTGGGTGTGIAAMINNAVDIANASREVSSEESQTARAKGIEPVEFTVARDAIAIIANPSNPVDHLTIQQISDIYSGKINNWQEVGGENRVIVRLSRETNSGTHIFFLEQVLRLGEKGNRTLFSPDTLLLPSSQGITAEVSENPNAIGYDGLGYVTSDVKMIAVSKDSAGPFILPSAASVENDSYPIARDLYMLTAGEPQGPILEYIQWIMTPPAQQIVQSLGFIPIKNNLASSLSNP